LGSTAVLLRDSNRQEKIKLETVLRWEPYHMSYAGSAWCVKQQLCNSDSLHCIYTSPVLLLSGTNAFWKQSSTTLVTSSLPTSAKGFRRRSALAASIQFEIVKDQKIPFAKRIASSVKCIQESGKMLGGLLLTLVHLSIAVAQ